MAPLTFKLPSEHTNLLRYCRHHKEKQGNCGTWIVKPTNQGRGKGIYVTQDVKQVLSDQRCVACEYIANPLKVDGKKLDMRLYVLAVSGTSAEGIPFRNFYLSRNGFVRFAAKKYSLDDLKSGNDAPDKGTADADMPRTAEHGRPGGSNNVGKDASKHELWLEKLRLDKTNCSRSRDRKAAGLSGSFDPAVHLTPARNAAASGPIRGSNDKLRYHNHRAHNWTVKQLLAHIGEKRTEYGQQRADELWSSIQQLVLRTVMCLPLPPVTAPEVEVGTATASTAVFDNGSRVASAGTNTEDDSAAAHQRHASQAGHKAKPTAGSHTATAFEFFGFDVMPDEELRPWLLEVNSQPGMGSAVMLAGQKGGIDEGGTDQGTTDDTKSRVYLAEHEAKSRTIATMLTLAMNASKVSREELDVLAKEGEMERLVADSSVGREWWGGGDCIEKWWQCDDDGGAGAGSGAASAGAGAATGTATGGGNDTGTDDTLASKASGDACSLAVCPIDPRLSNALTRQLLAAKARREILRRQPGAPRRYFASCPSGLEGVAVQEIHELFNLPPEQISASTGRVFFSLPRRQDPRPLRSIEKLFVHVGTVETPKTLQEFQHWCSELPWRQAHQSIVRFLPQGRPIRFRVSCSRSTKKISFTSQQAAHALAVSACEQLEDGVHQWEVDLRDYIVEVYCPLSSINATVGLTLAKTDGTELAHATSMSLRQSIAYSLATLADIRPADVVLDPMCGSGSLLVHAQARAQRLGVPLYLIGGDSDSWAVEKAAINLPSAGASPSLAIWTLRSIQTGFPLRTSSVDVVICDLPFGKRCSSAGANQKLYAMALQEFGRLLRRGTGRCVLLTASKTLIHQSLQGNWRLLWQMEKKKEIPVLHGGIRCVLVVLYRADVSYEHAKELPARKKLARRCISRFLRHCLRNGLFRVLKADGGGDGGGD
jgi:23S rRNA G2445 N2-methylase RlmL